ncbi:DNA/RNA non-specific endonuclease [Chromohalobacter sp. HP20-39]|uniref:DNA/RNA non-specific endonuclease n=1 Tax=Chromohalobacter sp. HP20-39 TaxID=3079306 RepID=UPI00294B2B7C|nr:DNA/RNA non-specific endonuclease [Chromohalobacter sp. HP20-39]MDV6320597.1 DNA/RNA non-specific endonuclease [Chromohalobacter sp. HP20-39]
MIAVISYQFRRLVRGTGIALIFAVVGSGLWYWQEREVREQLIWMGVPEWQTASWQGFNRVLRNDGFLVGWSDIRVSPLWVSYMLHDTADGPIGDRPNGFVRDWRSLWPVTSDQYTRSGYDRGHLAPNYAIARVYGRDAQLDTFQMTNITPQRPDLNRRVWQRLEEVVMDDFLPRFGRLQVVTGPVFDTQFLHRIGFTQVPEAFYKIIVAPGEHPRVLAFLIPQTVRGDEPLDRFLVSIDELEARTRLDFFPRLPDEVETPFEADIETQGWALQRVARRPGRYP